MSDLTDKTPVILYVDFPFSGPFGNAMAEQMDGLAKDIAAESGLVWKIWTENEAEKTAGGVYLFDNEQDAKRYFTKHSERLEGFGIKDIVGKFHTVNLPLSKIDRAPF